MYTQAAIAKSYLLINPRLVFALFVCLSCFAFGPTTPAQNIQRNDKPLDLGLRSTVRINPVTRGVEFQIPLGKFPGRAGHDIDVTVSYSSKVWEVNYEGYNPGPPPPHGGTQPYTIVTARYSRHSASGWSSTAAMPTIDATPGQSLYDMNGFARIAESCTLPCYVVDRRTVWMPDGSGHELRASDQPRLATDPAPDNFYAVGESRMRYQASTGTLFLADGSRYLLGSNQYVDPNGNTLTYSSSNGTWTDTLGRQIVNPLYPHGFSPVAGDQNYSVPGVNGTSINYVLKWRNLTDALTTAQPLNYIADSACPPGTNSFSPNLFASDLSGRTCIGNAGVLFNPVVLHQIVLPTGQAYTFTYNAYGEVDKVVLPTGGYERYQYGLVGALSSTSFVYAQANRGVINRFVSASGSGSDEVQWQYSGGSGSVIITAPAPDSTRTELSVWTDANTNWGYSVDGPRAGRIYDEQVYSASGQMIKRTMTNWVMTGSNANGSLSGTQIAGRHSRPLRRVEILLDTGGGPALAKSTVYGYDTTYEFTVGVEETSITEFDYVEVDPNTAQTLAIADLSSIPNGTELRKTTTSYLTSNASYRDRNLLALPVTINIFKGAVMAAQTTLSYDEPAYPLIGVSPPYTGWIDPATTVRGNMTTKSDWLNTSGTSIQTHMQYDQFGNVRNVWDARQKQSQINYSSTYNFAYPTELISADPDDGGPLTALTTTTEYDFSTGRTTAAIDANGQTTTFTYQPDPLNRLKQVTQASTDASAKTQTSYSYDDATRTVTVTKDRDAYNDNLIKTAKIFDGLERPVEHRQYETSTDYITVKMEYDALGRPQRTSNSYRSGETVVWTTTAYDSLGRALSVTTPDGSVVRTAYSGNCVLATDQAGKQRLSKVNALDQLIDIWEVTAPDAATESISFPSHPEVTAGYRTTYGYDILGNLAKVVQGSQQRFFMYDSLRRLIRAQNPEQAINTTLNLTDPVTQNSSWSSAYQYDENGNLTQKTDPRGVVTTYVYDALNRNLTVDYSDTSSINPDISRFYDGATNGKGRFWHSYAGGNFSVGSNVEHTSIDSYDALGRPLIKRQLFKLNGVWGPTYQTSRAYNRAGAVTSHIYPSGRSVAYSHDLAGRVTSFTGHLGDGSNRTYSTGMTYSPFAQLRQEQFGTTTSVYNKLFYNSRQQLAEILIATTTGSSSWNRGKLLTQYSLQCSGSSCNATDNNGNVRKQEVFIPADDQISSQTYWYQQYDYDALNRLLRVHEYTGNPALDWQQEYVYDRWGNRTIHQTNTYGTGIPKPNFGVNTARNQLTAPIGYSLVYNDSGNLTTDSYTGAGDRIYDAENRITQAWGGNDQWQYYTYDADSQRTRRKINGQETWQIYGFEGELLAEYAANSASATPQKEYGYRNGQLLITAEPGNPSLPFFADDFNDNSLDPSKWTIMYPGGTPPVTEESQQLKMTLAPNTASYNGVYSNSTFNLTGKMVQVEVVQAVSQAGWCENMLELELDPNNYFLIDTGAGSLLMRSRVNGVNDQTIIPYDSSLHRHWRIRHDNTANTINFETSADGTVWLTRKTVTPSFSLTSLRIYLIAGAYGTGNSTPGAAKYDNLQLLSSVGPSSVTVPNAGFETPSLGFGNFQYGPTGGSWNFINGGGISAGGSGFTGGSFVPEGSQVAFLQSNGEFSQSISGFQANTNYVITFYAAQRTNCCNPGGQQIAVYLDGTLLGTFNPPLNGVYVQYSTPTFTTTAGSHTVKFIGLNPGGQAGFVDHVRITGSPVIGSGVQWLVTDHLGTPRIILDESGNLSGVKRHDYLPFGEELNAGTGLRAASLGYSNSDGVRQQFTMKERDLETGLDYFLSRYYASRQGRFTSVDPENAGALEHQPQSWNAYSYVQNNPLGFIDPKGLERCAAKNSDGSCAKWVGDYDGEKSAEISDGIYKDGAYWNEDQGIWETKEQYESRTYDPSLELARELSRRTAWMETPGQIAVDLMPTPGPKIGILGFVTKRLVRKAATKALINITQKGLKHVLERHAVGGAKTAGKSIFSAGENIVDLIKNAESVTPVKQAGQTYERIVDAGRIIGTDRVTGQPTSIYTVITDAAGNLKTAFPGVP